LRPVKTRSAISFNFSTTTSNPPFGARLRAASGCRDGVLDFGEGADHLHHHCFRRSNKSHAPEFR